MNKTILRTNAIQVYSFLSFLNAKQKKGELNKPLKILDCDAGGAVHPLALFAEYGFETCGIDISDEQLEKAKQYYSEHNLKADFIKADMRQIPFENDSFDCVYEHYSMCHLSKRDTAKTVNEMYRVTKKNGYAFLGFISTNCWPKSAYGVEKNPGEFWTEQDGKFYMHNMFTENKTDQLVADWKIIYKQKHTKYMREDANKLSKKEWLNLYDKVNEEYSKNEWMRHYECRTNLCIFSHIFYILKKL